MKTLHIYLFLLIATIAATGCTSKKTPAANLNKVSRSPFQRVHNDSLNYSIEVFAGMSAVANLNADATLQYSNETEGRYIIVVEEPSAAVEEELKAQNAFKGGRSLIENFADFRMQQIRDNSPGTELLGTSKSKTNNLEMQIAELKASVPQFPEKVMYYIGFTEAENSCFMIMAWTVESKSKAFKPLAEKMIRSFSIDD